MKKTFVTLNRPNWLADGGVQVLRSVVVPSTYPDFVIEQDRKIVKSGSIVTSPIYGLILEDIDITKGNRETGLLYSGKYIDSKLPKSAKKYEDVFAKQMLLPFDEGKLVRPDFGGDDEEPTPTEYVLWQEGNTIYIDKAPATQINDILEIE